MLGSSESPLTTSQHYTLPCGDRRLFSLVKANKRGWVLNQLSTGRYGLASPASDRACGWRPRHLSAGPVSKHLSHDLRQVPST